MKSRRWREGRAGPWHSEDGVHLGVPPAQYGVRTSASSTSNTSVTASTTGNGITGSGSSALTRCRSTEDVSPRCRRSQFRLGPLAPAASVVRTTSLRGERAGRDSPVVAAAVAAAATATAAIAATAEAIDGVPAALPESCALLQTSWRGSAEERRKCFQRRIARWEEDTANCEAGVPNHHSADSRQDVRGAANCVRLDAKGDRERCGECVSRSAVQNGVVSHCGGNAKVDVHLQSWSERLSRHIEASVHPRFGEMNSPSAHGQHCVDESTGLRLQSSAANGDGRLLNAKDDLVGSHGLLRKTSDPDPSPPPTTPPTPTGDWVPKFVVSDCSGTAWPEPWAELLGGGGLGGLGGERRLSFVSECSTVSSIGWDRSRRGSLLDLDAEGLQLDSNGRLERADHLERTETEEWAEPQGRAEKKTEDREEPQGNRPKPVLQPRKQDTLRKISEPQEDRPDPAASQQRSEETCRKISSWSYSSVSTLSQDDEEELLGTTPTPSAPLISKSSQWRKVKGVVQWTPFVQTYKKQKYLWVQLAGHQGNFRSGKDGTIQKRLCGREQECLQQLMSDCLRPFVPEYRGQTESEDGQQFLQLQDLLAGFVEPCVMDCKIGVRTYLEEELAKAKENPKLRKDMYDKMMAVDKTAPTEEEHRLKAVTKPRYMVWRETISSTASLGFRIEGIRKNHGYSSKDFKTTRSEEQIKAAISMFTEGYTNVVPQYLARLKEIMSALQMSEFFRNHEFIGSSLLFVHDANRASVWLIDFAKTTPLPAGISISHRAPWRPGSHEDGYLTGAENLQRILTEMAAARPAAPV